MTHQEFQDTVWEWYKVNRRELPWRPPVGILGKSAERQSAAAAKWCKTHAYEIFVSEIMLQQTQVDRVVPFHAAFINTLPDWQALADCPEPKLLRLWKGLGYNRRALNTKRAAKYVLEHHDGLLPQTREELQKIPNVGIYTSAALMNFVHGVPTALIETNVRTVFFHHFYKNRQEISDKEIMKKVTNTMKQTSPREWMYALMDYGSHLRASGIKITSKSKHYKKQSIFKGSEREVRGKILEILLNIPILTQGLLEQHTGDALPNNEWNISKVVQDLINEGFLEAKENNISIKNYQDH